MFNNKVEPEPAGVVMPPDSSDAQPAPAPLSPLVFNNNNKNDQLPCPPETPIPPYDPTATGTTSNSNDLVNNNNAKTKGTKFGKFKNSPLFTWGNKKANKAVKAPTPAKKKGYPELPKPPESLAHLKDVKSFLIKLNEEEPFSWSAPSCCGCETGVRFDVFNGIKHRNQALYIAEERVNPRCGGCCSCCKSCCCRTDRPFKIEVKNPEDMTVMFTFTRPCSCACCCGSQLCGDTFGQSLRVQLPDGTLIGSITQEPDLCRPIYIVKNATGNPRFKIRGPKYGFCFCHRICCARQFQIMSIEESTIWKRAEFIGKIGRNYTLFQSGHEVDEDGEFAVEFPAKLDVRLKATFLGAAIFIDFLHFDKDPCGISQFCC